MSGASSYTLADLKTGSLFMIAAFAVAGTYLVLVPLMIFGFPFTAVQLGPDVQFDVRIFFSVAMLANLILGPLMFGLYVIFGRWVYGKIFPRAASPKLAFVGQGHWFHTLAPGSLYRAMIPCMKGMLLGFGCLFVPFWAIFLLVSIFTFEFTVVAVVLLQAGIMAAVYFIYPYIWGFFFMLGSYITRPVTRLMGWGEIQFKPGSEPVEEVFS